jgi:broad specificity phosphatase PhoE
MNNLILVRHGQSLTNVSQDFGAPDFQQLLTAEGVLSCLHAGKSIANGLDPEHQVEILCSAATRALQSAQLIASCLPASVFSKPIKQFQELNELHTPLSQRLDLSWFDYSRWLRGRSYPDASNVEHWLHSDRKCVTSSDDFLLRLQSVRSYEKMHSDLNRLQFKREVNLTTIIVSHHFTTLALLEKLDPTNCRLSTREVPYAAPIYLNRKWAEDYFQG